MRITQRPDSPSFTPPGADAPVHGSHRDAPSQDRAHAPAVSRAMRLLQRSVAAPNGFMSAEERAYLEHRRYSCE